MTQNHRLPLLLSLILGSTACIQNQAYRIASPVLHETPPSYCPAGDAKYTLAFIEFDDMGELWDAKEPDAAIAEIRRQRSDAPLVLLFVHGWKNDASDKSGNVWGFRCELADIANRYHRSVIGVYLGWRGGVTDVPLFKDFTFWNRITAASRIPGAHMTDVIMRIMRETKGRDGNRDATLIAVGHSFGGLVLERAVTQALVERIEDADGEAGAEVAFPADLVVFLNEAGPALQAKQLLDLLAKKQAEFSGPSGDRDPLLVSMTSKGDTATHLAFPGGQTLSLFKVDLRKYPGNDEFGIEDQKTYYLHTTANTAALQSHVIGTVDDPDVKASVAQGKKVYASVTIDREKKFVIIPKAGAKNTTPYWVMQMPVDFVPDHTTIFRPQFEALLTAFLEKRPDMIQRTPTSHRLKLKK